MLDSSALPKSRWTYEVKCITCVNLSKTEEEHHISCSWLFYTRLIPNLPSLHHATAEKNSSTTTERETDVFLLLGL